MNRAVLYRRTSTDEQRLGLAAQLDRLEAEAERRGWDAEVVTDEAVSGRVTAEEREHLGPAMDRLERGDVLVVAKLDRLSRSMRDFSRILQRAEREGWSIVVLDLGIDMTTHHGRLVAHILMAIAEWEREMIAQRVSEGMAKSSKRMGRKPGLPPVNGARAAPVPEPVRAVVRDARAQGLSPKRIADRLNSYGLPSLRGKRWHRESVRRLLARVESAS